MTVLLALLTALWAFVSLMTSAVSERAPQDSTTTTTLAPILNPVLDRDFPDPMVAATEDGYVAFGTNSDGINVLVATSPDLATWSEPVDAMPMRPAWVSETDPDIWAPFWILLDGRNLLFFTARNVDSGRLCLGVAEGATIEGPYSPTSDEPLRCDTELGGAIDPHVFVDDRVWLVWKNDGNCCGLQVWIRAAELDPDTLQTVGPVAELITVDQEWEAGVVEAPELLRLNATLYLFYSAGRYYDESYAIGYAVCETVTGPCTKPRTYPLLGTTGDVIGPGGQSVFHSPARGWQIAYHAWDAPLVGYEAGGRRATRIDPLDMSAGLPVILGPS